MRYQMQGDKLTITVRDSDSGGEVTYRIEGNISFDLETSESSLGLPTVQNIAIAGPMGLSQINVEPPR